MKSEIYQQLHAPILKRLRRLLTDGKLPTSLLFAGRKGVGKWVIADELTRDLMCLKLPRKSDCACAACRQVERFSHPDVHYLFPLPAADKEWGEKSDEYLQSRKRNPFGDTTAGAKQFIPLESVRRFQTNLSRKASLSRVKVGIISEAERMLPATMDSLLKLLEEPPASTHLLVLTDKPGLLHPTILSRLQRVNFPALDSDLVKKHLRENQELSEDRIAVLTRLAGGSLNGAAALSEGDLFLIRDVSWSILRDAFTSSPPNLFIKYGENPQLTSRDSVEQVFRHWQMCLRDCLLLNPNSAHDNPADQLFYPDLEQEYRGLWQSMRDSQRLFDHLELLEVTLQELRRNVNPRMAALNFLSEISQAGAN